MKSSIKAWMTLVVFSIGLILLGQHFAGRQGVLWAVTIALGINSIIYLLADKWVLASLGVEPVEGQDPWGLLPIVTQVAQKARLPLPQVFVTASDSPIALALGRSWQKGTLVFSESLLNSLTAEEMAAIVAQQLASIKILNTFLFTVVGSMVAAATFVGQWLDRAYRLVTGVTGEGWSGRPAAHFLGFFFACFARLIITSQSYLAADEQASKWLDRPQNLAKALWKLQSYAETKPLEMHPMAAFLCVVSPLTEVGWSRYFSIQPRTDVRIRRLVGYYPI